MERYSLRSHSYPFDWLISADFEKVLCLISNHFSDFMKYDNLLQYKQYPNYYYDRVNELHFYHDYVSYKPLRLQYKKVLQKYNRRIKAFYQAICQPTLFLRYCSSEKEVSWIDDNYQQVLDCIKRFNPGNDIIFIKDTKNTFKNELVNYFSTEKDDGDTVCRMPSEKNEYLMHLLESEIISNDTRDKNREFYSQKNKRSFSQKLLLKVDKIDRTVWRIFCIIRYGGLSYCHKERY